MPSGFINPLTNHFSFTFKLSTSVCANNAYVFFMKTSLDENNDTDDLTVRRKLSVKDENSLEKVGKSCRAKKL